MRFGGEIWGIHLHFGEMGWKLVLLGKSGAPAGPGLKTATKPIGFLGVLRLKSLFSGDFHVKSWSFLKFLWKWWIFMFLCEKVGKSWNRTPGWISREAVKVLCFIRFWERYLRPGVECSWIIHFYGNGWNFTTFHENEVIYTISSSVGWKWCPGGPGAETSTKPMLFLCLFRGSGHPKVGFGVDFHQKSSFGCFFCENHQNGWNSAESHHFH